MAKLLKIKPDATASFGVPLQGSSYNPQGATASFGAPPIRFPSASGSAGMPLQGGFAPPRYPQYQALPPPPPTPIINTAQNFAKQNIKLQDIVQAAIQMDKLSDQAQKQTQQSKIKSQKPQTSKLYEDTLYELNKALKDKKIDTNMYAVLLNALEEGKIDPNLMKIAQTGKAPTQTNIIKGIGQLAKGFGSAVVNTAQAPYSAARVISAAVTGNDQAQANAN